MKKEAIVELKNVSRLYETGESAVRALDGVSLSITDGDFVSIMGPSGSGKSTMMHLIGCLDRPTVGEVLLKGQPVSALSGKDMAALRNRFIGFVFQQFFLLPGLTLLENVETPLIYSGVPAAGRREKSLAVLERVGLGDRVRHRPSELSGGQKQRAAIARALVTGPSLLIADEPTGALDSITGQAIMDLFRELHAEGKTVIIVTHDREIGAAADTRIHLKDGKLHEPLS